MEKRCERCGSSKSRVKAGGFDLLDYCADCGRDLCDACMAKGCCGNIPARSGNAEECDADAALDREIEATPAAPPKRSEADLCASGYPITSEPCRRCGADMDGPCKMIDELNSREKRENRQAWLAGGDPPH